MVISIMFAKNFMPRFYVFIHNVVSMKNTLKPNLICNGEGGQTDAESILRSFEALEFFLLKAFGTLSKSLL